MGDLQPVIEAILNDAKIRATGICEEAERRINTMYAEFDREKISIREKFEAELDSETERIYESERTKGRQLLKNASLKAKTDLVKEAINSAKKKICNLSDAEYSDVLSKLYKNCTDAEKGVVYLNEQDKKRVKRGTFHNAKISNEPILTDGGFLIVCKNISYDCTLDSLFEEKYSEICDKINVLCREERQ